MKLVFTNKFCSETRKLYIRPLCNHVCWWWCVCAAVDSRRRQQYKVTEWMRHWGHSHLVSLWYGLKLFENAKWRKRIPSYLIEYSRIRLKFANRFWTRWRWPHTSEMSACFVTIAADCRVLYEPITHYRLSSAVNSPVASSIGADRGTIESINK